MSTTSSSAAASCCSATTTRRRWRSASLGAAVRELAVVDVDQRQLRYLAGHGVDTWFADLRVGLPAPLRDRFDIVLTDPPYSPAGIGLFAARALEAMKRESRLLVAYGYPEGSPALGLKVQNELSALELVYEALLPDFNAYDGALAIGSRAALYVLRPTKRSRKIAVRRGERHADALYTRGRQASRPAAARRRISPSSRAIASAVLRPGLQAAAERAARGAAAGRDGRTSTSRRTSSTASTRRRSRRWRGGW